MGVGIFKILLTGVAMATIATRIIATCIIVAIATPVSKI